MAEQRSLDIVIAYEYAVQGAIPCRSTISEGRNRRVATLSGSLTLEARRRAEEQVRLNLEDIERFIEAKGRAGPREHGGARAEPA